MIQCKCGRFMSNTKPTVGIHDDDYAAGPYLKDVIGDCSRCGTQIPAMRGYWHSWDYWTWPEGWE